MDDFLGTWIAHLRRAARQRGLGPRDVARLIYVSESSYHKRCRGTVQFSAAEFATLSEHFDLPTRPSELRGERLAFAVPPRRDNSFCASAYLNGLTDFAAAASSHRDVRATISSTDIPVFRLFAEPALAALKLYVFDTAHAARLGRRFDLAAERSRWAEHDRALDVIARSYAATPTCEVWGGRPLEGLLHQIASLVRARALGSDDLAELVAAIRRVVAQVGAEASAGRKLGGGDFDLYVNRLHATSTTVTATVGDRALTFLTVDNPHFVHSDRRATHDFFASIFERVRGRSTAVEAGGGYAARLFTEDLEGRIGRLEEAMGHQLRAHSAFAMQ